MAANTAFPIFNAPGITAERRRAFILREMAQAMGIGPAELQERIIESVSTHQRSAAQEPTREGCD